MAIPPPMVPAPITAALRSGSGCTCGGRSGMRRASRSAKKTCISAERCGLSRHSRKYSRSRAMASGGASVQAASMLSMIRHGASWPRAGAASLRRNSANSCGSTLRTCASSSAARRSGRRSAAAWRAYAIASAGRSSASASMRPSASARSAGICAPLVMRLERRRGSREAREALRAAGAGDQSELHLRQPDAGVAPREPPVTAERQLEAAAECDAFDGRHERLPEWPPCTPAPRG